MTTFTIAPDFNSPGQVKPKVDAAAFGDGYVQRIGKGINNAGEVWSLNFSARTTAERDAILAFFESLNGITPFDWTSPRGTVGRWVCTEWGLTPNTAAANTVGARFEQDFAP